MNKFVLTMLFILSAVLSHAQGMSDAQVMRYIQREVKAGTSQSQIAVKLMQRGVDMKQLQRVRQQVTASQGTSASKTATASGGSVDGSSRLRRSNGSVMVDAQGNPLYSQTNGFAMGAAGEIEDIASRPNVYLPDSMSTMVNGKHVAGQGLSGATVTIQGRSAVLSQSNGTFSFPVTNKAFTLQGVKKNGYQLVDADATGKAYQYSLNTFYIVMETPEQQQADKVAAERKLRRTLQQQLQKRENTNNRRDSLHENAETNAVPECADGAAHGVLAAPGVSAGGRRRDNYMGEN